MSSIEAGEFDARQPMLDLNAAEDLKGSGV